MSSNRIRVVVARRSPGPTRILVTAFLLLALLLANAGCGRRRQTARAPVSTRALLPSVVGAFEEGIASWYGHPYHGRRTANGEVYDQEQMTAAHPTLRFGVVVDVVNLSNGLRTRVRINDRGPFVANRAIDLSRAAAREIAILGPGTAPVRVEVVGLPGEPAAPTNAARDASPGAGISSTNQAPETFAVQVGAFSVYENALTLREQLAQRAMDVRIVAASSTSGGMLWRVLVGQRLSRKDADKLSDTLRVDFPRIFLVSDH